MESCRKSEIFSPAAPGGTKQEKNKLAKGSAGKIPRRQAAKNWGFVGGRGGRERRSWPPKAAERNDQ